MAKLNPGRRAALKALIAVELGAHAEEELNRFAPRDAKDRGLAWHLCLGTLRHQGSIDAALAPYLKTPIQKLDGPVRAAIRMGTFECAFSRTPARAAVDQTVEGVRAIGFGRASRFVNAVMRRIAKATIDPSPECNLPGWLYDRWAGHGDWLGAIQQPAVINVASARPPDLEGAQPGMAGGEVVPGIWKLPGGLGNVTTLDGYAEGTFWVMDPAAARVVDMLNEAIAPGSLVLDACAAPGGKSFRLARHGHSVTAVDRDQRRLDRMTENLDRLRLSIDLVSHDWLDGEAHFGRFDGVLVDAPCTALGTVRRHPEILWRRKLGDIAAMAVTQRVILRNASRHVKADGRLLYTVCSTEPEEGASIAESLEGWEIIQQWNKANI